MAVTLTDRRQLLSDDGFPFYNLVTTRLAGDMKDVQSRNLICKSSNIDAGTLVTAEQVHGSAVSAIDLEMKGKKIPSTDGLITNEPDIPLAIFTADCMPLFLASKNPAVVGVIHAGWRGLAAGIIKNSVHKIVEEYGAKESEIYASVGPHIRKCCYKIGEDLKTVFKTNDDMLDLEAIAVEQLKECGVRFISSGRHCTAHEHDMFFSYRREKTTARIMSLITMRAQ